MKYFIILLFCSVLASCGTDTGNPGIVTNPTNGISAGDFIGYRICNKIRSCFGAYLSDCDVKIKSAPQLTSQLGVNTTTYPLLQNLIDAVNNSTLSLVANEMTSCQAAIDNLTCGSSAVTSAYSSADLENLSHTYEMLAASTSCQRMIQ